MTTPKSRPLKPSIADIRAVERWIRATDLPQVWAAIERVECSKGTAVRTKNIVMDFSGASDLPHIERRKNVGSTTLGVLVAAMKTTPSPETAEAALLRVWRNAFWIVDVPPSFRAQADQIVREIAVLKKHRNTDFNELEQLRKKYERCRQPVPNLADKCAERCDVTSDLADARTDLARMQAVIDRVRPMLEQHAAIGDDMGRIDLEQAMDMMAVSIVRELHFALHAYDKSKASLP